MPRPMVMERPDLRLPEGQDFFTDATMVRPTFSRQETAKFFFARSTRWLIKQMIDGNLTLDGKRLVIPQVGPQKHYKFRLYDVERTAHALFECGILKLSDFESALLLVKIVAQKNRLI